MSELSQSTGQRMIESIALIAKPESTGEVRRGDVTKVDPDGRTWVRIEGNDFDTPCARSSVACKPGDSVLVSLRSNRATIEGNYTSPATDDSRAEEAIRTGSSAQQAADTARELADQAVADAQATHAAAERAEADANRAAQSAESAATSASDAATSAANAASSAADAAASAFSANESAESAYLAALGSITSLGTVQNVIESLRWMKDNPVYKPCPPGKYIDPSCDYYELIDGEYAKVDAPTVEGIPGYYVVDATATAASYVDSKLAVTDAGLYVTKGKLETWAEGDELPDGGVIGAPELDEEGNPVLDEDGNPVTVGAELVGKPKPQEAGYILLGTEGVTIYSKEGYPVATYGSSMKLGYGASSTTIESDMIEVIRKDIPTGQEHNVFSAGRKTANGEAESATNPKLPFVRFSDGYGHDLFTVDENGTGWFHDAAGTRANLLVPSIAQDSEGYWGLGFPDGTSGGFLRMPQNGIIPRVKEDAENSYLGTPGWPFRQCHAKNFYGTWSGSPVDVAHGGTKSTTPRDAAANLLVPSLVGSKYLGENTDLNTVVKFGTYYCTGSATVKTWKNCPTTYALRMTVANGIGQSYDASTLTCSYLVQEIVDLYANVYRRSSSNGGSTWSAWGKVFDTRHVVGVGNGGSGLTASPSMLVNLGSASAASVFQASPRPGVTGTLPLSHGGLGAATAAGGRSTLGLTYEGVYQSVQFATLAPGANGGKCTLVRRGTCCSINLNGIGIYGASSSTRTKIGVVPAGYRPAGSFYSWPFLIDSSGNFYCDMDAYSGYVTSWEVFTYPIGG